MDLFSKVGFLRNSAVNSSKYSVCLQVTNYSALKHLCGRRTKNIWVSAALAVLKLKPNVKLNGSLSPRPCFLESMYVIMLSQFLLFQCLAKYCHSFEISF